MSKGGQPPKEIDWELVKRLATIQCTIIEIAAVLDMNRKTLQRAAKKKFGMQMIDKLEEWREGGKASLRRKQWALAEKSAAMSIFLGKQYLGQSDNYDFSHDGKVVMEVVNFGDSTPKPWGVDDKI